ncbi:PGF-pre-PGF domain-containing protein [Methanomethylovorans sp. PtaU1.Bin093]|uniref:PGF-pre-PGF domain-containing protein n=1 Tax=Methanomethylovorans sp. PtaU1.Bin093 TaxID=1811679 RepID=UPI0025F855B2|nr:PGF-pre-PGF domain-containing protein [Methanomethylovorans sp. PtaU1.Bin093]
MQIKVSRSVYSGLVLFFLMLATGICSADNVNVDIVGQFSGEVFDVAVAGDHAYLVQGQDLVILDISDVAALSEVGRVSSVSEIYGIAVSGDHACIANGENGIAVVDVSVPSSPTIMGSYDTDGFARDVAISGNYAYVADGIGLAIVDISVPSSPTLAGTYDTIGFATGITVSGNHAYVADDGKAIFDGSNGIAIVDISTPSSPRQVGSYGSIYAYGSAVSGNYAYVADYSGLVILDVSDPSVPVLAGSYFSNGDSNGVAVSGNYAYVADGSGVFVVDVSDPSSPVYMGEYDGSNAYNVAMDDNYAFVADSIKGLVVFTISDFSGNYTENPTPEETDQPPVISGTGDKSVIEGQLLTFTVSATDPDGDIIHYSASNMPEGATFDTDTGVFSWTPDTEGNYIVTFTAESNGLIDSETIAIFVTASGATSPGSQISDLSGKDISSTSITLTWTNSQDVGYVELYRNEFLISNVTGSVSTYEDNGLASETIYTYSLLPYYNNGTKGNVASITLSTSSSSSGSSTGGGGSSGGSSTKSSSGGGGGGAGSVEDFANVAVKDVDNEFLRMNANVTYEFTRAGNDIQSVKFHSLKNSGEITSTIEVLNNRSKLVTSDPEGLVYKYINIWVGKSGFATEANIKDAVVQFKVNDSWIEETDVSPESIRLQRYNGTAWEVLPTELVVNTANYVIFKASTPGFSPFAITADATFVNDTDTKLQATGSDQLVNPDQTEIVDHGQTQPERSNFLIPIIAVILIVLLAAGYMYMKKK